MKTPFQFQTHTWVLLALLFSLYNCRPMLEDPMQDGDIPSDASNELLGGIAPPDGFTFQMDHQVSFTITVKSDDDLPLENVDLKFYTAHPDSSGHLLFSGTSNSQGIFQIDYTLPQYLETVYMSTDYLGLIPEHYLSVADGNVSYLLQNKRFAQAKTKSAVSGGVRLKSNGYHYMGSYNSLGVPTYLVEQDQTVTQDLLDVVNQSLPEGFPVPTYNPQYIDNNVNPNTVLVDSAELWITFVHEGAGFKNAIGYYTYPSDNPPATRDDIDSLHIIFPNSSYYQSGGGLFPGNKVYLGNFSAGTTVAWFLVPNGWDGSEVSRNAQDTKFSDKQLNTFTSSEYQNHVILLNDDVRKVLLLGFEDINRPGGDNDFNDAVFFITVSPYEAISTTNLVSTTTAEDGLDTDGDGIQDTYDDYPNDPDKAFNLFAPAQDVWASLAFEDLWPSRGDYDFNDVVVDYNYAFVTNAAQEVIEIEANFSLRAVGAAYSNGFGIELDVAPSMISSVEGSYLTESYINLSANGTEAGQSKSVIIVFDNAHTAFGKNRGAIINTRGSSPVDNTVPFQIKIKLNQPISLNDLGNAPYNPFIIVDGVRGHEVHLMGHTPTDLVDQSLFGTSVDVSDPNTGVYYQTQENLPFALHMPLSFDYPLEKIAINQGYMHFVTWANSGGLLYPDWYLSKTNYRDDSQLFVGN